ncbi:chemotaxis protein CheW [Azospirillum sp. TSH100]|uniref:Chemotaxis protein CheW n=3 Tax=Azospirillum TaxID=191 RepID=A0A5A9GPV7_AZOLI|nr:MULTISPECIES: chemotaxis protein CheW [Azospirillum]AWB08233.1 chemotaxis protein CheW [Azospirillum humicireducens]KAA0596496.1 chemotaxis protein CheW [Azospirillum lipoferum]MBP2305750.1 purine-binding chemotaxis protein CheW [Azospirillum melinis]MCP1610490.1 purine-binding chemotaxis protein CheW [Azospirillum lipoferum]MDW5538065.1 chemotaxis protein CheW [Azospirillum sp. NL1]
MSNAKLPSTVRKSKGDDLVVSGNQDYVTMTIADQMFGIPVLQVQDVLGHQRITRIPLAPPEVAGSLNLRGRIVTAIDVRLRLGLTGRPKDKPGMSIVVDLRGELYSLMVDSVGEVLSLTKEDFERNPATLDPRWREVSTGIYRLNGQLMVVLDVPRLLNFTTIETA